MIDSRQKGLRGERMFRGRVLDFLGIKMRQPQCGTSGDDGLLGDFSVEIKNTSDNGLKKLYKWVAQAKTNSGQREWLLAHRINGQDGFLITMDDQTFFKLARENVVTADTQKD
tara:strand:- start:437 stop:775 length:339 start_codon:yes stop_codon:yes gene_type:complete